MKQPLSAARVRRRVLALSALTALTLVAGLSAAPDAKPPRIVAAAMQDLDGDSRTDRVRLTYSERVRHAPDRDGKYPFKVAGYRIRAVGPTSTKTIVLTLVEKTAADHAAKPFLRYGRTTSRPVEDPAGNQAVGQLFRAVRAHGHRAARRATLCSGRSGRRRRYRCPGLRAAGSGDQARRRGRT